MGKKGQLVGIEVHFLLIGLLVGLVGALVLVYLGTAKILPFKIPFVCG